MQRPSSETLLAIWEAGRHQHPLDRALTLLVAALPGASREALADLSIGERDAHLFAWRTLFLGARAECFVECPECGERLEFPLDTTAFANSRPPAADALSCAVNGVVRPFRLPTSRDLAEVLAGGEATNAVRCLVERCQASASTDETLSDDALDALGAAMLSADPMGELRLDLACPACGHRWEMLFEIAEFLWSEISAQARRLLREVDTLARAYGWTEREILSLTPERRQTYLDLAAA